MCDYRIIDSEAEIEEFSLDMGTAIKVAVDNASCFRSKCGVSIIDIKSKKILGTGFNSPPENKSIPNCIKEEIKLQAGFKSDPTCCCHAEIRALINALENKPNGIDKIKYFNNARLYFIRLDLNNIVIPSDYPYCTVCSKYVLDSGVIEWCLFHDRRLLKKDRHSYVIYKAEYYNKISFNSSLFPFD